MAKSNLFLLDTNVDGVYVDSDNSEHKIENLIQVVGGSDGSISSPPISGNNKIDIDPIELQDIDDVDIVRGNRGHGLLYDKFGKKYAQKGDLVFRDNTNQASLKTIVNKVKSILETNTLDVSLFDSSLSNLTRSTRGITLDSLIDKALSNVSPFGLGNVVQATRNSNSNNISVSIFTSQITPDNTIWAVGHVVVKGSGTVRIRDLTSDTILTTSYACSENKSDLIPVYVSYVGSIPEASTTITSESCCSFDTSIYNSFYKRFFTKKIDHVSNIHEIALEIVSDGTDEDGNEIINLYSHASLNVLLMDAVTQGSAYTGSVISDNSTQVEVKFDVEIDTIDYSIAIQTGNPIQTWYSDKSKEGFVVNFEREYTGDIYWTVFGDSE